MAVHSCACGRHISVSSLPGGNPVALEEPEAWAFLHALCGGCGRRVCDRCVTQSVATMPCPGCGAALGVPDRDNNARVVRSLVEQSWKAKRYPRTAELLGALAHFGVELSSAEQTKLAFARKKA